MPDEIKIALRFGNYEVFSRPDGQPEELGRGGFGRTYRARHRFLGKIVALKVINEQLAFDETARRQFLREAREHSALEHPGIARLTDFGEAEDTFFYALEYCPDGDLKDYVTRRGALPPVEALQLIRQTAQALQFAHSRDILHRDVKPSNLLTVRQEGPLPAVKLIDFGLVKHLALSAADETLDHVSASLWSATFASPEQIREQPLDERTDIFSLGMTAWFLMAGGGPVEGTQIEIVQERLDPASYELRLPAGLTGTARRVVARMIEKEAALRYRNCTELLDDLRKALDQPASGFPTLPLLADRFILEPAGKDELGEIFTARDCESGTPRRVTRLYPEHPAGTVREMQAGLTKLSAASATALVPVLEVTEFAEGWAVIEEGVSGIPVAGALRLSGPVPFSILAPLLHETACAIDATTAAGAHALPPENALLEGGSATGAVDWSIARLRIRTQLAKPLHDWAAAGDVTAAPLSASPLQSFAAFIYLAIGGRRVPDKALYASSACVPIPGLGGNANRTLADCLSGEKKPADCRSLLQSLLRDEHLSPSAILRKPALPSLPAVPSPSPQTAPPAPAVVLRPAPVPKEPILLTAAVTPGPLPRAKSRHLILKTVLLAIPALAAFGYGGWYWKSIHRRSPAGNTKAPAITAPPVKTHDPAPDPKVPPSESEKQIEILAAAEKQKLEALKALEEKPPKRLTLSGILVERRLFNGKDLTGWKGRPDFWTVNDAFLTAQNTKEKPLRETTFLVWDGEVKDFELRFKYRFVYANSKFQAYGNAGVQYRSKLLKPDYSAVSGYQIDIGENLSRSGSLNEERGRGFLARAGQSVLVRTGTGIDAPDLKVTGTTGKPDETTAAFRPSAWNDGLIVAKAGHLQHFINGRMTVDVTDDTVAGAKSGIIALQCRAGPPVTVQFKDIYLLTEKASAPK